MPQGWDLGCWGVKNFSVKICDGVPSTAHSSFYFYNHLVEKDREMVALLYLSSCCHVVVDVLCLGFLTLPLVGLQCGIS